MYSLLAAHSDFSLMRGADSVEAVCAAAAARGAGAIALADVNGLYIAVRFWEAARERDLRPILGVDLWVEPPGGPAAAGAGPAGSAAPAWAERAILLAADARGYRRLCRIVSEYHLCRGAPGEAKARGPGDPAWPGGGRRVGRIVLPEAFSLARALVEDREGLWVLVPCGGGDPDPGIALAEAVLKASGPARLAVMISPGRPHRRAVEWARRSAVPAVATPDVFFVDPEGHAQHRLLRAIDLNAKLGRLPDAACVPKSSWLMPAAELARHVPDCPESIEAASRVAEACAMAEPPWGPVVFPRYVLDGREAAPEESFEILKRRAYEGAVRRYGAITRAVQERLDKELAIIRAKRFADYFLVVADIVRRSPRTCGRGSAAASLVSYALGITHVDPVRYDLYFERFLNMGRSDPPDIDVDFAWDERDDVQADVLARYGEDRAAMVCNHLCFRGPAAVREVAKVHGLPEDEIANVTKRLGRLWAREDAEATIRTHPLFKDVTLRPPWPEILKSAGRLEGHPRHLSVHCGGVVIVPDAVWDHVPVQPAAKGVNVIQWEKDQTEESGLVKIDLLGNRSLAVIRDALAAVKAHHGVEIPFERFNPLEDLRAQDLIRRGGTVGVFYVESPAMRQLQEKTGTGDFERLVVHSSIIRPAANAYIREYVRRLRGGAYRSIHPLMDEIMPETFGIMVYQEDVAKVTIAMAGFDAASADDLRKVLSKKHKERRLADYRERFYKGAAARGFGRDVVDAVWEMILSFAGYSFCKPHSASYALVSFKSAYLKAHYPAEFMAAVVSNQGGYYSAFAYVSECRRMGLTVLLPDVNASEIPYTGRNREVRVGLMQVQGMKEASREAIVAGRADGPYRSFEDFLARVDADPADVRLLVRAGAFDAIAAGRTRPELMWRWAAWNASRAPVRAAAGARAPAAGRRGGRAATLFEDDAPPAPAAPAGIGDYDPGKVLADEVETLGFLISRHPLALYRDAVARLQRSGRVAPARDLRQHVGREVTTVGWLVTGKVVDTKDDEPMEFVSFEDTTALYETTFFPEAYRRFCHMFSYTRPYVLRGKVEEDFGAVTLTVRDLRFLG
jgi:error-prone DNA polymerase